jgi:hypothetical protein
MAWGEWTKTYRKSLLEKEEDLLIQSMKEPNIGTCQSCGAYWDIDYYPKCPSCKGYVG